MNIDSETKLYCLIGQPVSKSLSPVLHNNSFRINNVNGKYLVFNVQKEDLKEAVKGLKALGVEGFNVTIPHKVEIIKYLDAIDEEAKLMGAVNTVKNNEGKLIGYNTDSIGFIETLKERSIDLRDKNVLIIGAGGAARAISFSVAKQGPRKITILNRTAEKAKKLVEEIKKVFPTVDGYYAPLCEDAIAYEDSHLVINCTSIGMYPKTEYMPLNPVQFKRDTIFYDIVYKPKITKFLNKAKINGYKIIEGTDMLIYQGLLSEEIWLDKEIDKKFIKNSIKKKDILKKK